MSDGASRLCAECEPRVCRRPLVSELVANAIRHDAGTTVSLRVRAGHERIRVEVHDDGGGFDPRVLRAPSTERGGGWGLPIVAALAPRWGVDAEETGTAVWFELDLPQREAPLPIRAATAAHN